MQAAIEKSGIKNWTIKEVKTPQKTQYIVERDGLPPVRVDNINQLTTAMLENVSFVYQNMEKLEKKQQETQQDVKPDGVEAKPETEAPKQDVEVKPEVVKPETETEAPKQDVVEGRVTTEPELDETKTKQEVQQEVKPDEVEVKPETEAPQTETEVNPEKSDIVRQSRNMTNEDFEIRRMRLADKIGATPTEVTKGNILLAEKLYADKDLSSFEVRQILMSTNEENIFVADRLYTSKSLKPREICETLDVVNKDNLKLAEKLSSDKDFPKSRIESVLRLTPKENINEKLTIYEQICADKDFPKNQIANILSSTDKENIKLAEKLCADKDFPKEQIAYILNNTNKDNINAKMLLWNKFSIDNNFPRANIAKMLFLEKERINVKIAIYDKLCADKDFPKDKIPDIVLHTRIENIELAKKLCADKDFPKDKIVDVLKHTNEQNINAKLSIYKTLRADKNFPKDKIADVMAFTNLENIELAEKLCADKDFPKEEIKNILMYTDKDNIILSEKLCFSKDFPKDKVVMVLATANKNNQSDIEHLTSSEFIKWFGENLNNGLSIDEIITLSRTQEKLNAENKTQTVKPGKTEVRETHPQISDEVTSTLVAIGVPENMAKNAYAKLCTDSNGNVDKTKLDAIRTLIETFGVERRINDKGKEKITVNILPNQISEIFKLATGDALSSQNGQFRMSIIADIVKFKKCGIDDVKLATNLAAMKNMSVTELKARFNNDTRKDFVERMNALDENVKKNLSAFGVDVKEICDKVTSEPKDVKIKPQEESQLPTIKVRNYDDIVGVEKVVLDKFKSELDQSTWQNPESFKKWAEEKLAKIIDFEQNENFIAKGPYAKVNEARKKGIADWYKYLTEESNCKDDVFSQLLVMDGITKDMRPNNEVTPPAVSHGSFEATLNALLQNNSKVSFSKIYADATRANAIRKFGKGTETVDGIEGQWVSIPRSQKGEPDYDEHIAMVQALSEGSSWCLRFDNAHNYLQGGALHFFLDKDGKAQVAINETDGKITQIQKRYDQNSTVPVPYAKVIDVWAKKNNYSYDVSNGRALVNALNAKPKFDELKTKITKLQSELETAKKQGKNTIQYEVDILNELGFGATIAQDGTIILQKYTPKLTDQYTLADLGINENQLMQNVSEIKSSLHLEGSKLTALPKLRVIKGNLSCGDNRISDLRSLKTLNGKKVTWHKPEPPKTPELPKTETIQPESLSTRLEKANSREDFVAIRDEINKLPNGEEKTQAKADGRKTETKSETYTCKIGEQKIYASEKWLDKYPPEDHIAIARRTEEIVELTERQSEQIERDYKKLGIEKIRLKTLQSTSDKIYRYIEERETWIKQSFDVDAYNVEHGSKYKEPYTEDDLKALRQKWNDEIYQLKYGNVGDFIKDGAGGRFVMDDVKTQTNVVFNNLLKLIDEGEVKIIEINNYQGKGSIPYFSSEQILAIEAHCKAQGYSPKINSAVDTPKGKEAEYEERYHSSNAIKSRGYTTFQLTMQHKGGATSELQIRGRLVEEFSEGAEHDIYALFENKSLSGDDPEIEKIIEPLKDAIEAVKKNSDLEKQFYGYLNDYYAYLRKLEKNEPAEKPVLPKSIDSVLDIDNVSKIHKQIEVVKVLHSNPLRVVYNIASFTPVEQQLILEVNDAIQKSLQTGKKYGFTEGALQKLYETGELTEQGICAIFDIGGRICVSPSDYKFFCKNKVKLTSVDSPFIIEERYHTAMNTVLLPDSPSFQKQAKPILDKQRAKMATVPKEGKVILVTGHPASGKSTATNSVVNKDNYLNVDPDAYKESFVEYKNGLGTDIVHKASGKIRDILVEEAIAQRTNLIVETTGNAEKIQQQIDVFKQAGYQVEIIHINRTPKECAAGLVHRADKDGRVVPPEILIDNAVKLDYTTIPTTIKTNNPDIQVTTFTNKGTLEEYLNSKKVL